MIPDTLCDQRIVASSMTRGPRFRLDSTRDGLALALDAQQRLGLRGGAATRNRDAIMIARIKLGLALVKGGQALDGATSILLGIMTNPLGLFRNRAYRRQAIRS